MAMSPAYGLAGANAALGGRPPGYGLNGANQALSISMAQRPVMGDNSYITQQRDIAMGQANQGIQALNGYTQPGIQAQQSQAALSGVLGPQAQQQAYANFQSSPGLQWLQQQAERSLLRNQAAVGGLGGGNVLQALQKQAIGLSSQDYQNQFNNMGSVADRGMQGANLQTNLYNTASQAATSAGAQRAGLDAAQIGANAQLGAAGISAATALARDKANYAFQTGQGIANNVNSTTSALAQLAAQQGGGLADLYGNNAGNIANLLSGAGQQQGQSYTNLAALLANISGGAANNIAGMPGIPGVQQSTGMLGGLGNAAMGIGAGLSGYAALGQGASAAGQLQPFNTSQYASMYR